MSHIELPLFDVLTPFLLENGMVRGRVVRLGPVAQTILTRYPYPPAVRRMLGELLLAAAMLSANLNRDGMLTIQMRGDGLVPLLVTDAVEGGALRGYAEVPADATSAIAGLLHATPAALVGARSYLAITLDQGPGPERYQGIVSLEGDSVTQVLASYFSQSVQLDVRVRLAFSDDGTAAAGMMIERMPDKQIMQAEDRDAWDYATAMFNTLSDEELLDPRLDAPNLLYRLFHEAGVRVYEPKPLSVGCRCSRERILTLLGTMPADDRAHMVVDGQVAVHCRFCNKAEAFTPQEIGL